MKDVVCRKAITMLAAIVFRIAVPIRDLENDEWTALERLSHGDFSWFEED
jgi:hypothetical protein